MKVAIALFVLALGVAYIAVGRITGKEYPFGFGWFAVPHARKTSWLVVLLSVLSAGAFAFVLSNELL